MRLKSGSALLAAALAVSSGAIAQQQPAGGQNRGVIDLMNQVEAVNAELKRLRGELEVLSNALNNAQRRQTDMYNDVDTRLRRLEGSGGEAAQQRDKSHAELEVRVKRLEAAMAGREAGGAAAATAPAATTALPTPTPPIAPTAPAVQAPASPSAAPTDANSPRRAYDAALATYRAGDYQGAIVAFDAFVKRHPRDALAPNAQYWIGDAWFNLRDFRAAANAQQALIAGYPDSPKVPDAMLNLSSAQFALGEAAASKKTLEDLVAKFPQSDAAEKARQRLTKLN